MTQYGYALLGLTAIVAMLVAMLTFAVLRFVAGARDARRHLQAGGDETTLLSAALQDAMSRLQAQERAMSARATASEQLSGQIVESITAGLLVVDGTGRVEILNPAGRRLLDVAEHLLRWLQASQRWGRHHQGASGDAQQRSVLLHRAVSGKPHGAFRARLRSGDASQGCGRRSGWNEFRNISDDGVDFVRRQSE